MRWKILIIEDESCIRKGLIDTFQSIGFDVEFGVTGVEAVAKALAFKPDLMILDVMLPCFDGFEVCRRLKERDFPIIMLTAKSTDMDKVAGFEVGIEDYLTKPFSIVELVARVQAMLKRREDQKRPVTQIAIGPVSIDFERFEALKNGQPVELTAKCFDLIHYLYLHRNKAIRRSDLMDNVWGMETDLNTRTIDNHVVKLRQLLEDNPSQPQRLITVHGIGYKLVCKE